MMSQFVNNPNGNCRLCTAKDTKDDMVACDECDCWFHLSCAQLRRIPTKEERWLCVKCTKILDEFNKLKNIKPVSSNDTMAQVLKDHREAMALMMQSFNNVKVESGDPNIAGPSQASPSNWTIYLKRQALMELPHFYGAPKEWPRFYKIYTETTKEGNFNNLENLNRLQRVLHGNAEKCVRQLMLDSENVNQIILRLKERFGRAEIIYKDLVNDLTAIKKESRNALTDCADALENLVSNINAIEKEYYLNDPRLVEETVRKLPFNLQIKWAEESEESNRTLSDLNDWLKPHAKTLRMMSINKENTKGIHVHEEKKETSKNQRCFICPDNHKTTDCQKLKKLNPQERSNLIFSKRLCLGCLSYTNHVLKNCRLAKRCGINGCNQRHHRLIHTNPKGLTPATQEGTFNYHKDRQQNHYYQVIPVTLRNGDIKIDTFAFLDAGSSLTLIDEDVSNQLHLNGRSEVLKLKWTQNVSREEVSKNVQLKINGPSGKEFTLKSVRTVKDLQLPAQTVDLTKLMEKYNYLQNLPIKDYRYAHPTILIGLNHSHLLATLEQRMGKENEPIAIRTKLGWLIFGNISTDVTYDHTVMIHQEEDLNAMIKSFSSTEEFGVKLVKNLPKPASEIKAEKVLHDTLKYIDGRFEVGLLWKDENFKFPNNYNYALKRLEIMENKLNKEEGLKKWAIETFQNYSAKGYIRKLSPMELQKDVPRFNYLPHFVVLNKNKLPPKPRLVFDAAAKVNGVSLNSALFSGPDKVTSLFGILLRFREGNIAVCGDIKEMFHQVRIRAEDQQAQRFLWRDCNNKKRPDVYVMQVMTFGSTCSPYCAQAVKNYNAERFLDLYPEAVNAIIKQHYVDDYVDSFWNLSKGSEIVSNVIMIHEQGGFHIRNFTSNSNDLLHVIPPERRATVNTKPFDDKASQFEKVLGVFWDSTNDCLSYRINYNEKGRAIFDVSEKPTRAQALSFIMSIYDPLGLISNLIIHGKIFMQELSKATNAWNEPIPDELHEQWLEFLKDIKQAENLSVPRCILSELAPVELHTFVDSSENAFAACCYARSMSSSGVVVRLIAAKARVAPIKPLSIPRLELQAALLGARLTKTIRDELRLNIVNTVFWSDSQTVLAWIKNTEKSYKIVISTRIGEILEHTTMDQWRWVSSNENPADEATKFVTGESKWFNGPSFLEDSPEKWPVSKARPTTDEGLKVHIFMHKEVKNLNKINERSFSDWWALLKTLCILRQFGNFILNRRSFRRKISYADRKAVEYALCRKAQWEAFPEEMNCLINSKPISEKSHLLQFNPFMDEHGVMRSRGRLQNAIALPQNLRQPILLPQHSHITKLIVKDVHERFLHQGNNSVLGVLQQEYWIINARAVLKTVKKACSKCIIANAKPVAPMMAPLPTCRVTPDIAPFTNTGVDYFGPFDVAVRRSTEKRWGVIFTCLSTRAVHIEMAEKLDTDSFLLCLSNFQNIRGRVSHLYSDNGTNFVGANNEMKALLKQIDAKMDAGEAAKMRIFWTFNPPAASHFGGAWERLIQIVKNCLEYLISSFGKRTPRPETLRSALIRASAILNSRPLTHIPIESSEAEVLTPFHFLGMKPADYVPPFAPITNEYEMLQWKAAQRAVKEFWNRWKKEYLPTLLKRDKWTKLEKPLEVDDIVLITDDNAPPSSWLRGRIIEVRAAPDGQVRSVKVKTAKGVLTRPAVRVAYLDIRREPEKDDHVMLHEEIAQPIQPSVRSASFPNWGKRSETDVQSIKRKAEELNSTKLSKRSNSKRISASPGAFARMVLTASVFLSVSNALLIKPIEDDGLMFDHQGTCIVKRGTWRTNISTNISISEDIATINSLHQKLKNALQSTTMFSPPLQVTELMQSVEHKCDSAIQDIERSSRRKRSKGVFGFLKDLFFGSNDLEETIDAIRINEDTKIHHLSESVNNINVKTANMSQQLRDRYYWLNKSLDTLNHNYSLLEKEALQRRMMETALLVKQIVGEILDKYRRLRSSPLTLQDMKIIKANITESLPEGYEILDHPSAIQYETQFINDTVLIVMKTVIVSSESFELFNVIPIPHQKDNSIIIVEKPYIAVSDLGRYFYPSEEVVRLNRSHFITTQMEIMATPDCISGAILRKNPKKICSSKRLDSIPTKIFKLFEANSFLYYTSDPGKIIIHCDNTVVTPPYRAGILHLQLDCNIRVNERILYADLNGNNKKAITFFKPRTDIHVELNITNTTTSKESPSKFYLFKPELDKFDYSVTVHKIHPSVWIGVPALLLLVVLAAGMCYYYKFRLRNNRRLTRRPPTSFRRRILPPPLETMQIAEAQV